MRTYVRAYVRTHLIHVLYGVGMPGSTACDCGNTILPQSSNWVRTYVRTYVERGTWAVLELLCTYVRTYVAIQRFMHLLCSRMPSKPHWMYRCFHRIPTHLKIASGPSIRCIGPGGTHTGERVHELGVEDQLGQLRRAQWRPQWHWILIISKQW